MKLLLTSAFAIAASLSFASADCKDGGCKKKGDGCKKKAEPALTIAFSNESDDGGCKKKGDGCKKDGGCKKKAE